METPSYFIDRDKSSDHTGCSRVRKAGYAQILSCPALRRNEISVKYTDKEKSPLLAGFLIELRFEQG